MFCSGKFKALNFNKLSAIRRTRVTPAFRYPPMAYMIQGMEFIETATFTRLLADLLTDDEYADLQNVLVENPERGDIIRGSGGLRKLRFTRAIAYTNGMGFSLPFCEKARRMRDSRYSGWRSA